jgi:hypothetical protein
MRNVNNKNKRKKKNKKNPPILQVSVFDAISGKDLGPGQKIKR